MPMGAPMGVQFRPVMPPQPVVVPQVPVPRPDEDDGPPNKKAKTEDNLVPEHAWLAAHPVCIYTLFLYFFLKDRRQIISHPTSNEV